MTGMEGRRDGSPHLSIWLREANGVGASAT